VGLKDLLEPEDAEFYEREYSIPFEEETEEEGRNLQSVASSLDWRQSGAVSSVKN